MIGWYSSSTKLVEPAIVGILTDVAVLAVTSASAAFSVPPHEVEQERLRGVHALVASFDSTVPLCNTAVALAARTIACKCRHMRRQILGSGKTLMEVAKMPKHSWTAHGSATCPLVCQGCMEAAHPRACCRHKREFLLRD